MKTLCALALTTLACATAMPLFAFAGDEPRITGKVEVMEPTREGIFGFGGSIGPENWGRLQPPAGQDWTDCEAGHAQTPIDFSDSVVKAGSEKPIQIHYSPVKAAIENLGTTIEVPYKNGSYIVIDGVRYDLLQFHLHTPSEHTVNGGANFPLEIHFVNQAKDGSLAVLGIFVKEGQSNAALAALGNPDELAQMIPRNENVTYRFDSLKIDGEKLLPKNRAFYRYQGSLTTPPCSEIVLWSVFKTPIEASAMQIRVLREALGDLRYAGPEGQNNRPLQPVNGRTVTLNP